MPDGKYRINSPTIALSLEGDRYVARTILAGTIITVESLDGDKLVEVRWDGKKGMMFAEDLRSRGERLGTSRSGPFARLGSRRCK